MRILIVGWPGSGKTTLAKDLSEKHGLAHQCTDPQNKCDPGVRGIPNDMNWSDSSEFVANHLLGTEGIVEGVAVPRALRKWKLSHPGEPPPADRIIWLPPRFDALEKGHAGMGKGIDEAMEELKEWLGPKLEKKAEESPRKKRVMESQG